MAARFFFVLILIASLLITTANGKELRMIAPYIPPHFDEQGGGRIGDVIAASLGKCGHNVNFVIVPFGRHWKDYEDYEEFDGLATAEADQTFSGFTTRPFIHLQDGATVLAGSDIDSIDSVTQLSGKRIVAFPNADKILGIEPLIPDFKSFKQRADRFDQVRPLFSDRADAVLADGLITAHFVQQLRANAEAGEEQGLGTSRRVIFRKIFPKGPQRLYFREASTAEDFDRCFAELLEAGSIEHIVKPYVDRYRPILGDQYPLY